MVHHVLQCWSVLLWTVCSMPYRFVTWRSAVRTDIEWMLKLDMNTEILDAELVWVSLFVSMSQKPRVQTSSFCACCPWPWLGPPLVALRYVMYFPVLWMTLFSRNGTSGDIYETNGGLASAQYHCSILKPQQCTVLLWKGECPCCMILVVSCRRR